jgi:hypothetical protein
MKTSVLEKHFCLQKQNLSKIFILNNWQKLSKQTIFILYLTEKKLVLSDAAI